MLCKPNSDKVPHAALPALPHALCPALRSARAPPCPAARAPLCSAARTPCALLAQPCSPCAALLCSPRSALPCALPARCPALQSTRCPALQPASRPARQLARYPALQPARATLQPVLPCCPRRPGGGGYGAGGTGGTEQQRQSRRQETLSPQQLREWVIQRGRPGGGGYGARHVVGSAKATSLGACEPSSTGAASVVALRTFTLDSGVTRCFFRDCTTVTLLTAHVSVSLAGPSEEPVVARASTVLLCPAAPSGSLTGHHPPSFSKNLVSNVVLQNQFVIVTTPGGELVAICTNSHTGEHLASFTRSLGSGLYTLTTQSAQVATSGQVTASGQLAASCSCPLLSHQTLLWHHHLGHPSLPRLHSMHSRLLVSGLPRSLPLLPCSLAPPCLPYVEGWQCAAPHSSFPPTTAPLQTLHMDVWGPACVRGQDHERYFLLVVDDYTRHTTVFPLRSKHNGIAERRIGLVMEVSRISMIHAAAPHILWPFAVRYAAHQLNLWPHVSMPETSPTLRWTGEVGNASAFRV
ncbi:unnamed protein product [Closterium sp. NIES-53]